MGLPTRPKPACSSRVNCQANLILPGVGVPASSSRLLSLPAIYEEVAMNKKINPAIAICTILVVVGVIGFYMVRAAGPTGNRPDQATVGLLKPGELPHHP